MQKEDVYRFAHDLMHKVWIPFDPSNLDAFYHSDVVGHHRAQTLCYDDIANRLVWDRQNISNPHYDIKDIIADDDRFSIRFIYSATLIRSGRDIEVEVLYFYHLRNDKIAEFWTLASIDFDYKEKAE